MSNNNTVSKPSKKISMSENVEVQSCVIGTLVWVSKRTGYKLIWNDFGDTNPMTVEDLLDMRNGDRAFFENNWVTLIGDKARAIMDYLQVSKYYKTISTSEDIDEIFKYNPDEISGIIGKFGNGTKEIIAQRAAVLIKEGKLDSLKLINAISTATGFDITAN